MLILLIILLIGNDKGYSLWDKVLHYLLTFKEATISVHYVSKMISIFLT